MTTLEQVKQAEDKLRRATVLLNLVTSKEVQINERNIAVIKLRIFEWSKAAEALKFAQHSYSTSIKVE